jgi:hypothetical protein
VAGFVRRDHRQALRFGLPEPRPDGQPVRRSYSYTADSAGSKWVELVVGNGCGSNSKRSTYDGHAGAERQHYCPVDLPFSFNLTPCEITVVVENVPAGVEGNPPGDRERLR